MHKEERHEVEVGEGGKEVGLIEGGIKIQGGGV